MNLHRRLPAAFRCARLPSACLGHFPGLDGDGDSVGHCGVLV